MESDSIPSTAGTIIKRSLAAFADNWIAIILGVIVAKNFIGNNPAVQTICFVSIYLGYFFLFEAFMSRTPGKLGAGLIILRTDGDRISVREAAIRTIFRVLEVNPALLGALPAAISIFFSRHNQRFGDKAAGTIVVRCS